MPLDPEEIEARVETMSRHAQRGGNLVFRWIAPRQVGERFEYCGMPFVVTRLATKEEYLESLPLEIKARITRELREEPSKWVSFFEVATD